MDEQVLAAMKRWPDVPDVYGWLRLDRRGRWLLIDRNRPDFDEAVHGNGSPITNTQIVDFIARNYQSTEPSTAQSSHAGQWYWQNGPQRAFVELDVAPWICRVLQSDADGATPARYSLVTHTGAACDSTDLWQIGEDGVLYVLTEHGVGAIHDLDLSVLQLELDDSTGCGLTGVLQWNGRTLAIGPLDQRLTGFVKSPLAASGGNRA